MNKGSIPLYRALRDTAYEAKKPEIDKNYQEILEALEEAAKRGEFKCTFNMRPFSRFNIFRLRAEEGLEVREDKSYGRFTVSW